MEITSEHPVHVEGWDKVPGGELLAALNAEVATHTLFPSTQNTRFGDWVKAGALKPGDKISTLFSIGPSIENAVAQLKVRQGAANDNRKIDNLLTAIDLAQLGRAAKDNQPLTIAKITADIRAQRVYNLEINSRDGEITHNYVVGDDLAWVHNGCSFQGPNDKPRYSINPWFGRM